MAQLLQVFLEGCVYLPLLPTMPHGVTSHFSEIAVTFGYKLRSLGEDFHLSDQMRSQAHQTRLDARLSSLFCVEPLQRCSCCFPSREDDLPLAGRWDVFDRLAVLVDADAAVVAKVVPEKLNCKLGCFGLDDRSERLGVVGCNPRIADGIAFHR